MLFRSRPSTRRRLAGYEGVIRDEKDQILWACDHTHQNRDQDGFMAGTAAHTCAGRAFATFIASTGTFKTNPNGVIIRNPYPSQEG